MNFVQTMDFLLVIHQLRGDIEHLFQREIFMIHDGSGKPEKLNHQEKADSENFAMGSDAAEFVDKVKDLVRNRQKRMSNVADSGEEHLIIW